MVQAPLPASARAASSPARGVTAEMTGRARVGLSRPQHAGGAPVFGGRGSGWVFEPLCPTVSPRAPCRVSPGWAGRAACSRAVARSHAVPRGSGPVCVRAWTGPAPGATAWAHGWRSVCPARRAASAGARLPAHVLACCVPLEASGREGVRSCDGLGVVPSRAARGPGSEKQASGTCSVPRGLFALGG